MKTTNISTKVFKDFVINCTKIKEDKKHNKYLFESLNVNETTIVMGSSIYHFVEILNSFISNHLHTNTEYEIDKLLIKIAQKDNQHYLKISIADEKEYFFEKYECRIMSKIISKVLSKCDFLDFT